MIIYNDGGTGLESLFVKSILNVGVFDGFSHQIKALVLTTLLGNTLSWILIRTLSLQDNQFSALKLRLSARSFALSKLKSHHCCGLVCCFAW